MARKPQQDSAGTADGAMAPGKPRRAPRKQAAPARAKLAVASALPVEAEAVAPVAPAETAMADAPSANVSTASPADLPGSAPAPEPASSEPVGAANGEPPAAAAPEPAPIRTETRETVMNSFAPELTTRITETMSEAVSEMQARLQEAFDKSSAMLAEMTDLAKGNVEAVVESGRLLASGMQDMSRTYAEDVKTAFETMTADMKEMAAVRSPTEMFQLQGKIMRRNFDMLVAHTSKATDAALKLANDAMAPISSRMAIATEKLAKVA